MRPSTVRWIAIALVAALLLGVGALALIGPAAGGEGRAPNEARPGAAPSPSRAP